MSGVRPRVALISALTAERTTDRATASFEPPLGVLSLGAELKSVGLDTEIIDLNLQWIRSGYSPKLLLADTTAAVRNLKPRVLGLSTICSSYPLTIRLAQTLKKEFPQTSIVLGGPQASLVDVATLNAFPSIDFVLRGEAEKTFPMLVSALLRGRSPARQPGLTFRDGSTVRRNPDAPTILSLDALPLPSFDLYANVSRWPSLPLEIGRGCPFSCRFCSTSAFFRRRYRLKSTQHVIDQMTHLSKRYGVKTFNLIHDMFTADRARVVDFCDRLIALRAPFSWSCSARTDCVDRTLIQLMRSAGCAGIFFGIETGSPRLQNVIQKHLNLDKARSILADCNRLQINTTASLIIGYPDESTEDLEATLSFLESTIRLPRADAQLHVLEPLAETSLEREYRSRLHFDALACDVPEFGAGQPVSDRDLIESYPRVFSNFYSFPNRLPRSTLYRISEFFVNLQQRCRGLLSALLDGPATPLTLFDEWTRWSRGDADAADHCRSLMFLTEFLDFVEAVYVKRGAVAVDVMWRFYSELASAGPDQDRAMVVCDKRGDNRATHGLLRLSPGVRIVAMRGDVAKVLDCLAKGLKPGAECGRRRRTVFVKRTNGGRFVIGELSPLAAAIVNCLDGSVEDIVRKLTARHVRWEGRVPAQFVSEALRILKRDGFISCSAAA